MLNAFQVYDKNNKGAVSREDFKRVLKHFTVDLTRNQVEVLLNRLVVKFYQITLNVLIDLIIILLDWSKN